MANSRKGMAADNKSKVAATKKAKTTKPSKSSPTKTSPTQKKTSSSAKKSDGLSTEQKLLAGTFLACELDKTSTPTRERVITLAGLIGTPDKTLGNTWAKLKNKGWITYVPKQNTVALTDEGAKEAAKGPQLPKPTNTLVQDKLKSNLQGSRPVDIFNALLDGNWWDKNALAEKIFGKDYSAKTWANNFAKVKNLNVLEESPDKKSVRFKSEEVFPYGRPNQN